MTTVARRAAYVLASSRVQQAAGTATARVPAHGDPHRRADTHPEQSMHIATPWPPGYDRMLRGHLPFLAADEPLLPESALIDLGLDSLGMVALLVGIEEEFGVFLPDEMLGHELLATAGTLWDAIEGLRADAA